MQEEDKIIVTEKEYHESVHEARELEKRKQNICYAYHFMQNIFTKKNTLWNVGGTAGYVDSWMKGRPVAVAEVNDKSLKYIFYMDECGRNNSINLRKTCLLDAIRLMKRKMKRIQSKLDKQRQYVSKLKIGHSDYNKFCTTTKLNTCNLSKDMFEAIKEFVVDNEKK